jgi:hypothetical protein
MMPLLLLGGAAGGSARAWHAKPPNIRPSVQPMGYRREVTIVVSFEMVK